MTYAYGGPYLLAGGVVPGLAPGKPILILSVAAPVEAFEDSCHLLVTLTPDKNIPFKHIGFRPYSGTFPGEQLVRMPSGNKSGGPDSRPLAPRRLGFPHLMGWMIRLSSG